MDLSAKIGNLNIDPAIINGSGIFSHETVLKRLPEFGAFVTKSIGLERKTGFIEPIIYSEDSFTLNCVGLSNPGCEKMAEELKEAYPLQKPLIASIFGGSSEELLKIASTIEKYCDAFELNFGCPNLEKGAKHGMIIGRDSELVRKYTRDVRGITRKPIIVKLTPNVYDIESMASSAEQGGADAISVINTVSPGMKIDIFAKKPVLSNKFGGVSGPAIRPVGVACVYKVYDAVGIPVIGMGGIRLSSPEDFLEYIEAGASACAIGTGFAEMDTNTVNSSLKDFIEKISLSLEKLGVSSLRDLVGAAHEL
jgi:dihydroorotate dehydrogenase (NAD+) catalytic subunit